MAYIMNSSGYVDNGYQVANITYNIKGVEKIKEEFKKISKLLTEAQTGLHTQGHAEEIDWEDDKDPYKDPIWKTPGTGAKKPSEEKTIKFDSSEGKIWAWVEDQKPKQPKWYFIVCDNIIQGTKFYHKHLLQFNKAKGYIRVVTPDNYKNSLKGITGPFKVYNITKKHYPEIAAQLKIIQAGEK